MRFNKSLENLIFLLVIFCLILSCNDKSSSSPNNNETPLVTTPNNDTQVDTSDSYDEVASDLEDADRIIWQKPDLVISILGDIKNKTVADIGAGTGYFTFRLADKGARVIGIDVDPRAIAYMNEEKKFLPDSIQDRVFIRLSDFDDARLKKDEADMALLVNTYIYLDNRISYFKRLREGLKNGAKVVIIDFKKKITDIGPDFEDRISLGQVESELVAAGYEITKSDDSTLDYQYIITAKLNK